MRNHPAILAYFPSFDRFQKRKKTAKLKREWLFFIKFSIKMPEFNRFPPKAYVLGLRIFACARYLLPLATNCPFNFRLLSRYYYPYIYPPQRLYSVLIFLSFSLIILMLYKHLYRQILPLIWSKHTVFFLSIRPCRFIINRKFPY